MADLGDEDEIPLVDPDLPLDEAEAPPPPKPPKVLPRIVYQPPEGALPEPAEPATRKPAARSPDSPPRDRPAEPVPAKPKPKPKIQTFGAEPSASASPSPKPKKAERRAEPATPRPIRPKEGEGALIEATPESETFDSRRKTRLMVGAGLAAVIVLAVVVIVRSAMPGSSAEPSAEPGGASPEVARPAPAERPQAELESLAKSLLDDARQFEKAGKLDLAFDRLDKIDAEYPRTDAARRVAECRERYKQGLPLFVGGPAVVATKIQSKSPEKSKSNSNAMDADAELPSEEARVEDAPKAATTTRQTAEVSIGPASAPMPNASPAILPKNTTGGYVEPYRPTGVGLPKAEVEARAVPPGFHARDEAGVHASGWPLEITCDRDGSAMIFIPGGEFTQGRDDGPAPEKPAHKVRLSPFYIDQHEVTVRQLALSRGEQATGDDRDRPAVKVSLPEAKAYAQWAGKTLPTEAQWEMAARTTDGRVHPWGNAPAAFDRPRQNKQIDPVMSFPSDLSPYGVFDLAGNAWEWTNDLFDIRYYAQFKNAPATNPQGPAQTKSKLAEVVIKGGSNGWDASWRSGMRPDAKLPYLGFRGVLNLEAQPGPAPAGPNPAPTGGTVPF